MKEEERVGWCQGRGGGGSEEERIDMYQGRGQRGIKVEERID
jgi:hypothetical protein